MKLTFRLKKSPEFVFEHLTDMQKFVSVHPIISQIEPKGSEQYLVHETLRFLRLPFSFTYPVTLEVNSPERIVTMRANVMKLVKIEMKFVLKPENDFTFIEENINFRSALPVKFILQSIFKKQHRQLFKNIEQKQTAAVDR